MLSHGWNYQVVHRMGNKPTPRSYSLDEIKGIGPSERSGHASYSITGSAIRPPPSQYSSHSGSSTWTRGSDVGKRGYRDAWGISAIGNKSLQSRRTEPVSNVPSSDLFSRGRPKQREHRAPSISGGPVQYYRYPKDRGYNKSMLIDRFQRREVSSHYDDDDAETLAPCDSISQVSGSGLSGQSRRSTHSRRSTTSSGYESTRGYNTVVHRPQHLAPYPEEDEQEWRAETGFGEAERPYYDAYHDFNGNYMLDLMPDHVNQVPGSRVEA